MTKNIRRILEREFQGWIELRDKCCEPALNAVTSAPQTALKNMVEEYRRALIDLDHIEARLAGVEHCDAVPPDPEIDVLNGGEHGTTTTD